MHPGMVEDVWGPPAAVLDYRAQDLGHDSLSTVPPSGPRVQGVSPMPAKVV
jgi:hypothetical protein